jgi:hypothetical protein
VTVQLLSCGVDAHRTDLSPHGGPSSALVGDEAEAPPRRADMDEQQRCYRDMQVVLEDLVNAWPAGHSSAAYQAAITYLHTHCEGCGAPVGSGENALLRKLEAGRISTWGPSVVEFAYPLCADCYAVRLQSDGAATAQYSSVKSNHNRPTPPGGRTRSLSGETRTPPQEWSPTLN